MSAADWPLLEPAEEDALHLNRLLTVDERPFGRITKRLLAKDALITKFPAQLPTPPPDATQDSEHDAAVADSGSADSGARNRYYDDVLLDFANLESSFVRIQLLKDANERERARYAAEKSKILATAESVRANTAELRIQLAQAQKTLDLKKQYDALTEAINKDKALKPRDVLESENEKLRAEIEELEQEGRDFTGLWSERKERFDRVVDEGKSLVRFIKGEEERDSAEEDEEDAAGKGSETKGEGSIDGSPRPDAGSATPMHTDLDGEEGTLSAQQELANRAIGSTQSGTPSTASKAASPTESPSMEGGIKDAEMLESVETPQAQQVLELADGGEVEVEDADNTAEKMDTT